MKISICTKLLLFIGLFTFSQSFGQSRDVITLHDGWRFSKGNIAHGEQPRLDDSKWQQVTVPHDWAIGEPTVADGDGNTGKLPWKGEGWYRRLLDIPASYAGKDIILIFDGVMAMPEVFVNGQLAGKWDYGYNSFYVDITKFLQSKGKNLLAVHADTRQHDSRWYPGAGIYRKVQMMVVDPVHVGVWGTQITTPVVKVNYADVRVMNTVVNNSSSDQEKIRVENIIVNPKGIEIARAEATAHIAAGASKEIETTTGLSNPHRWDIENPVMYRVKTNIYRGDQLVDSSVNSFGIRTIRITADNGLYLNDKRVQLKGVNLHQDQGPLGSAFYPRAMERQIEIMQSMGCNAIRTSHNMPAPELLELCDRMGMLVFDEAFDKYDRKMDFQEEADFDEFARRNIKNFIERDRNHPCVFIWSFGNEMADVQYNKNNGFHKMNTMISYIRKYDPTRPVTMACDNTNSALLRHFDFYDVHSWNYGRRYSMARQMEPNKGVIVSESGSTVSTRGYYELPLPVKRDAFSKARQVSSYDLNVPYWADLPDEDFMWQQDEGYIAGEFVWTGFDYLGEPTPYTNDWAKGNGLTDREASRSSYFGIVDLCGIPKDRYFLYKSYWKPEETTVHILPHWNWEGTGVKNVPVFVYTNGDCAELFLNGKSLGKRCKQPTAEKSIERFRLMWNDVAYQPGELKAVAYKEGEVIGEAILKTAGEPYRLRLTPDRSTIHGDGMDLSYLLVEAVDKDGNVCPLADNKIEISMDGPGHIAGVGNGNPQSFDPFQASYVNLFYGKAMIILGAGTEKGTINISVSSGNLQKDSKQIQID
jgi:beta-galactosidase